MGDPRKILVLQAHNLGDAVISTSLVETIGHSLPGAQIDVLTRPEICQIFANNPFVQDVFIGRFPMGSMRDFGLSDGAKLMRMISMLRGRRYTDVVNLAGDFREEFLGWMIGAERNWTPKWGEGHPCAEVIRRSAIPIANRPVLIPKEKPSVYDAAAILGGAMCETTACQSALYTAEKKPIHWNPTKGVVGIHPMASQAWRRWDLERWREVAKALIADDRHVQIFGAPSDAANLKDCFDGCDPSRLQIVTGSLSNYFTAVAQVELLLCHDSFASHVAYAIGVPTVFLNGANDANAWAPPGAVVFSAGSELPCYPCYNRPTCVNSPGEFACVRDISTEAVVKTVERLLADASGSAHKFCVI